eukprot:tig00000025_g7931.t1
MRRGLSSVAIRCSGAAALWPVALARPLASFAAVAVRRNSALAGGGARTAASRIRARLAARRALRESEGEDATEVAGEPAQEIEAPQPAPRRRRTRAVQQEEQEKENEENAGEEVEETPAASKAQAGRPAYRTLTVPAWEDGTRLDRLIKRRLPGIPFSRLQRALRERHIRVGSLERSEALRLEASARIPKGTDIYVPESLLEEFGEAAAGSGSFQPTPSERSDMLRSVLYRDDHIIVINKPPGLATQGGSGVMRHVDGMLDVLRFGSQYRPKLIHRLDKDASGCLILGRTPEATAWYQDLFRSYKLHTGLRKLYWAVVLGAPRPPTGRIVAPLEKIETPQGERVVIRPTVHKDNKARSAITEYEIRESFGTLASWIELEPVTGRTHQLRVHCSEALGAPILGDSKYGTKDSLERTEALSGRLARGGARQLHLHARRLVLPLYRPRAPLPSTLPPPEPGQEKTLAKRFRTVEIVAPLPPHFRATFSGFQFPLPPVGK